MTTTLSEQELEIALRELKECTMATMETVGVRCARRVNTTLFKQGLSHLKGDAFDICFRNFGQDQFFPFYLNIVLVCAFAVIIFIVTVMLITWLCPGPVVVQPPSEDRVSIFMSLTGGKQASLKIFSTGKVRCLKSDFSSLEHAQGCAQAVIDRMAGINNSGMPPIRLRDAKVRLTLYHV